MKDQKYYEDLGWKFDTEVWYDGHNNDKNIDKLFKSPRMGNFKSYFRLEDLENREAFIMATNAVDDYTLRCQISKVLTDYYLENPNAIDIPRLKITID